MVYSSLRGLTAPAIHLRADLRRVFLNVLNNNNNNNNQFKHNQCVSNTHNNVQFTHNQCESNTHNQCVSNLVARERSEQL